MLFLDISDNKILKPNQLLTYNKLVVTRSILNGNIFKNSVLAPIFNFFVHTGSRFPVSKMSYHAYDQA